MDKDFLLSTNTARKLYNDIAAKLPIIDYHCHIPPIEIAENKCFENITQVWLYADHYKWRAMRACGVPEEKITGNASDKEKFLAFAKCMEHLIGNPLYHWSHLELSRYFGIDTHLSEKTAESIWERSNTALAKLSVHRIMQMSNVETICTTDDPADSLEHHKKIAQDDSFDIKILPAFRPDRVLGMEKSDFAEYISLLGKTAEVDITSIETLCEALKNRMDVFASLGCKAADHGLTRIPKKETGANAAFEKRMAGGTLSKSEEDAFHYEVLEFLSGEYTRRGWVMEIHFGVLRNTNMRMFEQHGVDSGFDNMGSVENIAALTKFLDAQNSGNALPKTLLFSINPFDNAPLCTLCGAFGDKVQQGSAWWFNDTLHGMREQITTYASLLPLGKFTGFLTDSRSFLSYTRHEYFRRIICEWIGKRAENGEFTSDNDILKSLVKGICYDNAKAFFEF